MLCSYHCFLGPEIDWLMIDGLFWNRILYSRLALNLSYVRLPIEISIGQDLFIWCVCVSIYLYVWASCECWCIQKPEKGIESLGTGVPDRCETSGMDAGTQTLLLWKSSPCSELLSHSFSPTTDTLSSSIPLFPHPLAFCFYESAHYSLQIFRKMKLHNMGTLVRGFNLFDLT